MKPKGGNTITIFKIKRKKVKKTKIITCLAKEKDLENLSNFSKFFKIIKYLFNKIDIVVVTIDQALGA